MADRSVGIDLIARVSGFVAGINTARAATKGFIADLEKSAKKQQALRELGNAAGVMGAVAAAGFFAVVKASADFDQAMSNVQAATHETSANMEVLRQAALDAGQSTVFSATESAAAIEELSKAGVSTADILGGGLTGALNLAAAGGIEVADAAEIAASAMTQFGLSGEKVPHIADLLAAGAGKAQGSVQDLGMALNQAGLVANQTGLTIEETTGGLAAFASAGLTGSDAGTSFKTMLQSLTPRSAQAADLMEKLNISAYDSQGNFIGLTKYAGKLQDALSGMSEQQQAATLKTIFGSDAVRAASVLYKQGADGIQGWIDKTNDAGYAAETAATRMDNLKGDLEQLRGALETALIGTGDSAQGPLRAILQTLTDLINAYNGLPGPVKSGLLAITGLTAVIGLSAFAASRAVLAYGNFKTNMATLGVTAGNTSKGMMAARAGALGLAIGLATLNSKIGSSNEFMHEFLTVGASVAAGFAVGGPVGGALGTVAGLLQVFAGHSQAAADAQAKLDGAAQSAADSLNKESGALSKATTEAVRNFLASQGAYGAAQKMGIGLDLVTKAALGNKDAIKAVTDAADAWAQTRAFAGADPMGIVSDDDQAVVDKLTGAIGAQSGALARRREQIDQTNTAQAAAKESAVALSSSVDDLTPKLGAATDATGKHSKGAKDDADAMKAEAKAADAAAAAIRDQHDALLEAIGGQIGFRNAVRDAMEGQKKFNGSIFSGTKAADEQLSALTGVAGAWNGLTPKVQKADGAYQNARAEFLRVADAMNVPTERAKRLADQWLDTANIVEHNKPRADVDTAGADRKIGDTKGKLADLGNDVARPTVQVRDNATTVINGIRVALSQIRDKTVTVNVRQMGTALTGADGGLISHYDGGGPVQGPGGPRDDKVPAWLSNGEFVVNAAATQKHLGLLFAMNSNRFADGGPVDKLSPSEQRAAARDQWESSDRFKELTKALNVLNRALDRATTKYDNATQKLDAIRQASESYAAAVKSAFTHDALGGTLADSELQLRADRNDARSAGADLKRLRHRGISGALLKQLQASGNVGLIDELTHLSPKELREYERLFKTENRATSRLGSQSANAVYGRQIREQTHATQRLHRTVDHLTDELKHLRAEVRQGAHDGTRDGIQQREHRAATRRKANR